MKGYNVPEGYMGYVNGKYILFASESDYIDYMLKIAASVQRSRQMTGDSFIWS